MYDEKKVQPLEKLPLNSIVKIWQKRGQTNGGSIKTEFIATAKIKFDNILGEKYLQISSITRHWQYGQVSKISLTTSRLRQFILEELGGQVGIISGRNGIDVNNVKSNIDLWVTALSWQELKDIHDNIGRNDECPCGSGKKYKKCHIEKISKEFTIRKM